MASSLLLCCMLLNLVVITLAGPSIYGFNALDIDGEVVSMDKYKGKLLLIVNVASQCGYTDSNYKALEEMYNRHKNEGFEIAAFPCNQFGSQEPWKEEEIKKWADETYSVSFDMYSKVEVTGDHKHSLFRWLIKSGANKNAPIEWNFDGKFLIDTGGQVIKRWTNSAPLSEIDTFIGAKREL